MKKLFLLLLLIPGFLFSQVTIRRFALPTTTFVTPISYGNMIVIESTNKVYSVIKSDGLKGDSALVNYILNSDYKIVNKSVYDEYLKIDQTTPQTTAGIFTFPIVNVVPDDITVTNYNKYRPLLNYNGNPIARFQDFVWNGSDYVASLGYGFGYQALYNNTGAYSNGFGMYALYSNTGAYSNGFGMYALRSNTGAYSNGFGMYALYSNTGAYSNGFGHQALYSNTGAYSNGFGMYALRNNTGASSNGFGMYALYNNTGAYSNGFGMYALQYNNWPNAIKIGHQSTPYFLVNSATDKSFAYADIDGTAHTITYSSAHGFGTVGGKINLKFTLIAGTAPTGLVNGTVYQFTVTSTTVLTYASIISQGSVDFEGKLTNSADITNSIAIGYNVNASKANQVVLGNSSIVETLLNGNIGIQLTSPTSKIHLAAGSVTANTAPLGFTSGALLTVPVPGKVEFLTDAWYGTITTGAERKQFAFTSDITAAAHDPVTLGTANGLSLSIQELSLGLASPSITGALSSNDWNTFNTKVGGSGTANYIPKFTGSGTIGNSIIYQLGDSVGIGIKTPTAKLAVNGTFVAGDFLDYIGSNLSTKLEVGNNAISLLGAGGSEHIYIGDVDNVGNGNYIDFDQAGYFKIKQPMTAWTYDRSSMFDPNVFFHMKGSLDVYDELGVNIFILENPSSALNGLQAWSPAIQYRGYGYKTNAPAGSQPVDFRSYVITEQGTANPTGYLKFESRVNNGVYANPVVFTTKGGIESMTAKFTTGAGLNYVAVSDAAGLLTWTDPATVLASYVPTSRTLTLSGSGAITIDPSTAVDLSANRSWSIAHSTADGYLHVPETSTTNEGKVLTAGATAGALTWETPAVSGATVLPTFNTGLTVNDGTSTGLAAYKNLIFSTGGLLTLAGSATDGTQAFMGTSLYSNTAASTAGITVRKSHSDTFGTLSSVLPGDYLGRFSFYGAAGATGIDWGLGANIYAVAKDTFDNSATQKFGTALAIQTVKTGETSLGNRIYIDENGKIGISQDFPTSTLHVTGSQSWNSATSFGDNTMVFPGAGGAVFPLIASTRDRIYMIAPTVNCTVSQNGSEGVGNFLVLNGTAATSHAITGGSLYFAYNTGSLWIIYEIK